jgi:hypothetical protein
MKFSTSPRRNGSIRVIKVRIIISNRAPKVSFTEKYGWNGILSKLEDSPSGLVEPG